MFKTKNKIIKLSSIFIVIIIFTCLLFPSHYATDTYNIIELGFEEYAKVWFSPSGRTVGMILLYVLEIVGITCDQYIFISKIIAVILATITIYLFNELLLKFSKCENNKIKEIALLIVSMSIFLNHGTYQFFYYPEACVMWLGVLMVILAVKASLNYEDKFKFIKSFICIFVAMNCYQSVILFYIPVRLLFLGLERNSTKDFILSIVKDCFIVGLNLILGYIIIEIYIKVFNSTPYLEHDFYFDIIQMKYIGNFLLFKMCDAAPNIVILIVNIFVIIFCAILPENLFKINKKKSIVTLILLFMSSFAQVLLLISLTNFYIADRIQFPYIALIALEMAFLVSYTNLIDIKKVRIALISIFSIFLILNIWNSIDISIASIKTRKSDVEIGNKIADMIEEYESKNQKVEKVIYCYDSLYTPEKENIRNVGEQTYRVMAGNWVLDNAIRYFSNKKDLIVELDQQTYNNVFEEKEWEEFSEEQIKFIDNTMYYCIY